MTSRFPPRRNRQAVSSRFPPGGHVNLLSARGHVKRARDRGCRRLPAGGPGSCFSPSHPPARPLANRAAERGSVTGVPGLRGVGVHEHDGGQGGGAAVLGRARGAAQGHGPRHHRLRRRPRRLRPRPLPGAPPPAPPRCCCLPSGSANKNTRRPSTLSGSMAPPGPGFASSSFSRLTRLGRRRAVDWLPVSACTCKQRASQAPIRHK